MGQHNKVLPQNCSDSMLIRYTITVILFLIVISHYSIAQNFNRVINPISKHDDNLIATIECANGNYLGVGSISPSFLLPNPYKSYSQVYMLNSIGDTLWTKRYDINFDYDGLTQAHVALELSYGEFIIAGNFLDTIEQGGTTYIMKIDSLGNQLWFNIINAGYSDKPVNIMLTDSNFILLLGYYYTDTLNSDSKTFIIKIDSSGNFLTQTDYYFGRYTAAYSWHKTLDGGIIFGGEFNPQGRIDGDLMLAKLKPDLQVEWVKNYGTLHEDRSGYRAGLINTVSSEYIMCGRTFVPCTSNCWYERTEGYVIKTDSSGNLIWQKHYSSPDTNFYFYGIQPSENGYVVGGGIALDTFTRTMPRGYLMKIDTSGNKIWSRTYTYHNAYEEDNYAWDLIKTSDGGYLLSGYLIYNLSDNRNDAWLVKTDSCGYTEGDVSIAQIQLISIQDSTVRLNNRSPQFCSFKWYFGNGDSSTTKNPTYTYSDTGTYTIMLITQAGNEKDTAYLTIHIGDTVVSSPHLTAITPQLKLYPNPATQYIILSGFIPQETGKAVLEFYDMQGKLIKQEPLEQGAINRSIGIREFSQGVYAYKVFSSDKIITTGRIFVEP